MTRSRASRRGWNAASFCSITSSHTLRHAARARLFVQRVHQFLADPLSPRGRNHADAADPRFVAAEREVREAERLVPLKATRDASRSMSYASTME